MTFFKKTSLVLAAALALSACSSADVKYAALSERPMTLYTLTKQKILAAASIKSESSRVTFLTIPFGEEPSLEKAIASALSHYDGDYIANAKVSASAFGILGIYEYSAWTINGDVVRIYE